MTELRVNLTTSGRHFSAGLDACLPPADLDCRARFDQLIFASPVEQTARGITLLSAGSAASAGDRP